MKNVKKIIYKECKYRIVKCQLIFPDNTTHEFDPDLHIPYVYLEKQFDTHQYPYMEMLLYMPNDVNRKMRQYNEQVHLQLVMRYALFEKGETPSEVTYVQEKPFINDTFLIFADDASTYNKDPISNILEENAPCGKESKNTVVTELSTMARVILYKENELVNARKIFANVINNTTVMDAATYMLMNMNIKTKILMSPSTNSYKYSQFIIPPMRMDEGLERICNDYALHDNGSTLFFDYDRLYIIDKINKCTAWEPNEEKVVYVVSIPVTEDFNYRTGAYKDAEDNEIYITTKNSQITSNSVAADVSTGSGFTIIDKRTGNSSFYRVDGDKIKAVPNMNKIGFNRTIVVNSGETDTIKAIKERLNEKSLCWQVFLDNTMISALTPNKEFKFVFTDEVQRKYNGTYRLTSFISRFSKEHDGKFFSVNTEAAFLGKAN